MRCVLAVVVCVTIAPAAFGQAGKGSDLWDWTKPAKHHDSVVKVQIEGTDERGARASATGVVVRFERISKLPNGEAYCLTAAHVIESVLPKPETKPQPKAKEDSMKPATDGSDKPSGSSPTIIDLNKPIAPLKPTANISVYYRTGEVSRKCQVVAVDEQRDVALLRVALPKGKKPARVAANPIKPGDSLEFAGLGGGSSVKKPRHFNAQASAPTTSQLIFADAPLLPGDSGGAVFNKKREVVGIISGGWIWWEGGVRSTNGQNIPATWPARACNLTPIRQLHRARKANRRANRR